MLINNEVAGCMNEVLRRVATNVVAKACSGFTDRGSRDLRDEKSGEGREASGDEGEPEGSNRALPLRASGRVQAEVGATEREGLMGDTRSVHINMT